MAVKIIRWAVVAGYAGLAIGIIRSRLFLRYPIFAAYCCMMVGDLAWNPLRVEQLVLIEPWLLSLRFCAVVEAAMNATAKSAWHRPLVRRNYVLFGLSLGIPATYLMRGLIDGYSAMAWYHSTRLAIHTGLAMMCLSTCLCYMLDHSGLDPCALKHYLVLTLYLTGRAVAQIFKPADWAVYYAGRLRFFAFTTICLALWSMLLRSRRVD